MENLTMVSSLVKSILIDNPAARNSDNYLFYLVCKTILQKNDLDVNTIGFTDLFLSLNKYHIPKYETVGRTRRKLQAQFPDLQGTDAVRIERQNQCDRFKEYAMEGMN